MNTTSTFFTTSAALAAAALLALGCGGARPPSSAVGGSAPGDATATGMASPAPSPTASNVSISDEIRTRCGIPDEDAYFQFDSARVTSSDRSPLDLVAKCFTQGPLAGHSVKLVGRADPRGSSDYNLTLGQSRADAVGGYLDARGLAKDKTQPTSRGAMDASGSDEGGWKHDRRVDVILGN